MWTPLSVESTRKKSWGGSLPAFRSCNATLILLPARSTTPHTSRRSQVYHSLSAFTWTAMCSDCARVPTTTRTSFPHQTGRLLRRLSSIFAACSRATAALPSTVPRGVRLTLPLSSASAIRGLFALAGLDRTFHSFLVRDEHSATSNQSVELTATRRMSTFPND